MNPAYEAVIGLEVHMQLSTKTKAYSSDPSEYGSLPNTNVSPITLGHPGTLPVLNEKVVEFAVRLGIAVDASITEVNEFARKNYFYADLPKGYQITQHLTPICTGGSIKIKTKDGEKKINLTRIHIEEDAGKSIHDVDPFHTLVDLNRAGVPLLEMVSEPEIKTGEEAYQYLMEVRKLIRYLDICDGNMEEGSMRCDANISVMKKGATQFGTKVEVKNMNSMRNVQRAIEFEINRQIEALENGETLYQETRSFDAGTGTTSMMRSKEAANDYRYFPEPDMPPVIVREDYINHVKQNLPTLPHELAYKFANQFGLSEYDINVLTDTKEQALFFEEVVKHTNNYKSAANWVMGQVKSMCNEQGIELNRFPIKPAAIAEVIKLIDEGKISNSAATQKLFPALFDKPDANCGQLAESLNLIQQSDEGELKVWVEAALAKFPEKVQEYRNGKKGLLGLFMGEVMKLSAGKADPKLTTKLVQELLEQN